MAYDFGSKELNIENPFKTEGLIRTLGGLLIAILGLYSLFNVTTYVADSNLVKGWVYALVGLVLLASGFKRMGTGLFQLFKFFVGRSAPTSLSYNLTKSERENANLEKKDGVLAYKAATLESMLMGRKNATFTEPLGWMGRFVHSILPKLIFLPYPLRNISQEIVSTLITTIIAFFAFGITYFVSSSGLAGEAGHLIIPSFSIVILVYLVGVWRKAANAVSLDKVKVLNSVGAASIAKVIAFSIIFPVAIGALYHFQIQEMKINTQVLQALDAVVFFSAWPSLFYLTALGLITSAVVFFLISNHDKQTTKKTEVSEFRENFQESVHPSEIFINIENIVLANRRHNEIPNRTYMDFEPVLKEQSQGKGSFSGELLIETQPEFVAHKQASAYKIVRLLTTIAGQALLVIGAVFFYKLAAQGTEIYSFVELISRNNSTLANNGIIVTLSTSITAMVGTLFFWQIMITVGRMLENFSHVFWAELQFNSLLMYIKTEGTFSESKMSTGMSIHDSTRSENVIVNSSITPWVVSSRITSSTFATSGTKNIEMPRYVMSMEKNDEELESIVSEIRTFLRSRENIAGFSNTADLQHVKNISQVNNASRQAQLLSSTKDEIAGYLRDREEADIAK